MNKTITGKHVDLFLETGKAESFLSEAITSSDCLLQIFWSKNQGYKKEWARSFLRKLRQEKPQLKDLEPAEKSFLLLLLQHYVLLRSL
jgi:hypothetical protein